MSGGRSFRSVFMVASCAGAALGCYLVSLRVASERAALEEVEQEIVLAQRDIRVLQTEIGTRGRLAQLEKWNAKVLALSAPTADQFLSGGFALAQLTRPEDQPNLEAPVILASAPAEETKPSPLDERPVEQAAKPQSAAGLMHQASLKVPARQAPTEAPKAVPIEKPKPVAAKPAAPKPAAPKPAATKATVAKATTSGPTTKKVVDNKPAPAAKPVTKPVKVAKADPLAPLPGSSKTAKETGPAR